MMFRKLLFFVCCCLPAATYSQTATTGPFLDIRNYGVIVNSTGDNTVNFQRAVDTAAFYGGTLCLPAGIYRISGTINVPAGVSILGAGMGAQANQTPSNGTLLWYTGDSAAMVITGSNSSVSNCTVYNPPGTATVGIQICANAKLVESILLSRVLISGFTGGTGLRVCASDYGGVSYCSFYDVRVRHAKTGIEIREYDEGSFVNSNTFFHGVVSGAGFDYGIRAVGGNNNVFYSTIVEPYTSVYGHLVVNKGQVVGEQMRIEAANQPAGQPVLRFDSLSSGCRLSGVYGGGPVLNNGNNEIQLSSGTYMGESHSPDNLLPNGALLQSTPGALPDYWTATPATVTCTAETEEVISNHRVLTFRIPPGTVCNLYPKPEYAPKTGTAEVYDAAHFNVMIRTAKAGKVRLTYNYAAGLVSSAAHTGSGAWETIGLKALTSPGINPAPKINLNNSAGIDTLVVSVTAPSFNFGLIAPNRQSAPVTGAGGIMTGTLTTGLSSAYAFTPGTTYLVLSRTGNVFQIGGTGLTIARINHLTADRFPPGTVITLLFAASGNTVQNSAYVNLKSTFLSTGANTSLTLLAMGDGTWRELGRNN